jgi:thiamine biosynthesis lipoprotein
LYRYFLFVLYGIGLCGNGIAQGKKYSFSQPKMGSPFNIILVANDSLYAVRLADRAFSLVDSFNHVFSDYDLASELNQLNNTAGDRTEHTLSPALWDILLLSKTAFKKSDHAFDITVGPYSTVWRKARKEKRFPSRDEIIAREKAVGFDKIKMNIQKTSASLPVKGMRLDLGGIAKGYIAQKVIDFLHSQGIHHALADAGGDMVMSGAPVRTEGWVIGINIPETSDQLLPGKLQLQNKAVATSGDVYQYMEHKGKKYSHIIDPRTGYGIISQRNVTVIAADGATADWLATACSILPIARAKQLAIENGAELLITVLEQGKIKYHSTTGFRRYWKK